MALKTEEISVHGDRDADAHQSETTFDVVPLDQIAVPLPPRPPSFWGHLLPPKYATLLCGHGGLGKTKLATALACHVAIGKPFCGLPVRKATVTIFTAEDDGEEAIRAVQGACAQWGIDPREVAKNLHVLDGSEYGSVLFDVGGTSSRRQGRTTPSYVALKRWVAETGTQLLIIDNASEVFAGNEIDRAQVKQFMRELKRIVRPTVGNVLLLVHSDKASARGHGGSETYSGSTSWHNSSRSRFSLHAAPGNTVRLTHDKANHSAMNAEMHLSYSASGFLVPVQPLSEDEERQQRDSTLLVLLRLIAKKCQDGGSVATSRNSCLSAANLFQSERASLGCRRKAEINDLAEEAERRGLLASEPYAMRSRHEGKRWALTAAGRQRLSEQ